MELWQYVQFGIGCSSCRVGRGLERCEGEATVQCIFQEMPRLMATLIASAVLAAAHQSVQKTTALTTIQRRYPALSLLKVRVLGFSSRANEPQKLE